MPVVPAYYAPGLDDDPRFEGLMERLGFFESVVKAGSAG
jgi:hypothetical protein